MMRRGYVEETKAVAMSMRLGVVRYAIDEGGCNTMEEENSLVWSDLDRDVVGGVVARIPTKRHPPLSLFGAHKQQQK